MGEKLDRLESHIQEHVRLIAKTAGIPQTEEALEDIARAWWEKKESFEQKIQAEGMEEKEHLAKDDVLGAVLLTYSGSLLLLGPLGEDNTRRAGYFSIGLRQDVPDAAEVEKASLKKDVSVDSEVFFEKGPIQKSSPIFKIAVPREELAADDQEELLGNVTQVITEDFVEVNKTVITD